MSLLEEILVLAYQARRAHAEVLAAQQFMYRAAARRTELVADLYYRGLSMAEVAEVVGVSPSRGQELVEQAREAHPWRPTPSGALSPLSAPSGPGRTAADSCVPAPAPHP